MNSYDMMRHHRFIGIHPAARWLDVWLVIRELGEVLEVFGFWFPQWLQAARLERERSIQIFNYINLYPFYYKYENVFGLIQISLFLT